MLYIHKSTIQIPYRKQKRKKIGGKYVQLHIVDTKENFEGKKVLSIAIIAVEMKANEENWTIDIHCNVGKKKAMAL